MISEILNAARACGEAGDDMAGFFDALFAQTIHEDLAQYQRGDLAAAALGTWDHLQQRKPGLHKIRIINPDISVRSEYGWQTAVTVIEIINDNMPFLVDSVMGELQDRGLDVHLVLHPVLALSRDEEGRLAGPVRRAVRGQEVRDGLKESLIHIHVDRIEQDAARNELANALSGVLDECRLAVKDWPVMVTRLEEAIKSFQTSPPPIPVDEIAEAIQFLRWLADNNFTLLGMREYAFDSDAPGGGMERLAQPGLGILSNPQVKVLRRGRELVTFTPEVREFLMQPVPLIVTKANVRSRVHRRAHMDYVGIKLFSPEGKMSGELRVIGLFTSTAYTRSARSIPFLRRKIDQVVRALGFNPTDHSGKALINVLEQFPRDELFQIDIETLTRHALAILQLGEHPRLRVLARPDRFDRYVSVLLYVPRDRYSTSVREKVGDYLARTYDGRVSAYYPTFLEGRLVRVHFIIGRYEGETPNPSPERLEEDIAALVRTWSDDLHLALGASMEGQQVRKLQERYGQAFPVSYQEAFSADAAVHDISFIEQLSATRRIAIDFVRRDGEGDHSDRVGLKLFNLGEPIFLTDRVPVLENMGFRVVDERSYSVLPEGSESIWMHDMTLETDDGAPVDLADLRSRLDECFTAVWGGQAENDGYNALVLRAGIQWRDIAILRAYSRYLRQIRTPFSQDYMWQTMARHPAIAASLIELFRVRFDPDNGLDEAARAGAEKEILAGIEKALQAVDNLDEDRIVRHFVNLAEATLRTSVYQRDQHGDLKPAMAFKIRSRQVDGLPAPRPYAEIFVYSPRVEGVHLRFGEVARGGLRWSDRPQDFRTEVLGLVKAQQVKNAVIVPVGAKGGFVPKRLPAPGASREEISAEGIAAYKIFVSSLLDITDNLEGGEAVPPQRVVRHDGDDPYLVVAADKGTASFSDIANEISENRHFWLGDAFASGGSVGYDHKKMGIT
ncbi:MAG TPA: NAD-glutamate dehydrogenase, partial [Hyphomicrobiales bacterium]|nr:NAD-glutamate dehydrogenase [Hyphomicrobiales bacterium]